MMPLNSINCVEVVWKGGGDFRPERWLNPHGQPLKQDTLSGGYIGISTFLSGPRMCIGYRLGG